MSELHQICTMSRPQQIRPVEQNWTKKSTQIFVLNSSPTISPPSIFNMVVSVLTCAE